MTPLPVTRVPLTIAADHPAFAGHFPARPIVPGVVLLDECLRAIGASRASSSAGSVATRVGTAKFLSTVGPGEALRLEFEASSSVGYRVRVYAGDTGSERLALTGAIDFAADPVANGS